jgi:hypothetical protein
MNLEQFAGVNAAYVLELYERYRQNPESVDPETRKAFESWTPETAPPPSAVPGMDTRVVVGAANLVESIRRYGHLAAHLDPLGSVPVGDPSLSPRAHGITDDDLKRLPASLVGGPVAESSSNAYDAIEKLRRIYCSTTGFDYAHVFVPEEREWLRHAAESGRFLPPMDAGSTSSLLNRITQVEVFERFLHRTFPGKTRFSIEGLDMLVPILDEVICGAADSGTRQAVIGMAHRGRLNVLAHILQKPYAQILAEFKDPVATQALRTRPGLDGRREVSRRRQDVRATRSDACLDGAEPEPSRSRESSGRGDGPGGGDRCQGARQPALRGRQHPSNTDSWRCGISGTGHRRRDVEPLPTRWVRHRRHDSHHLQQPDRVHRDTWRVVQHQLRERPGARIQDSDRPRQR